MSNPAPSPVSANEHDARPLGISLEREHLRKGDLCKVTVEAQMMGQPTGVFLNFKQVVYRGTNGGFLQFDSEIESHFFAAHEIVRVALVEHP